jgi:hypothetical protein
MGWATSLEMEKTMGTDDGEENVKEDADSPGGIVVETLLNMGTVSALTMQEDRYRAFEKALDKSSGRYVRKSLHKGVLSGLSMFLQQWINASQFYFGGWLLFRYPERFTFNDLLISIFCFLFSLFGLGVAFQDISDRKETEQSASRIFYLLDRKSEIDPLNDEGKVVDYSVPMKKKTKKEHSLEKPKSMKNAEKKKKRASSLKNVTEDLECPEDDDAHVKKPSSSTKKKKSKRSSKKVVDSNDDGTDEKPKSSKKKKSKKKHSDPEESEEIVFFPEETSDGAAPAGTDPDDAF